uniref:Dynein regulatory complex subunit 4 n=1 Tax=Macrostomum lignano TaxID=282301 RepID=A0A1I8FNN2_9PLAT
KEGKKGKKSGKKGKKSGKSQNPKPTVIDGISTAEMTKEDLEEHVNRIIAMSCSCARTRGAKPLSIQLERDKDQHITKRQLEEKKAELRNKDREMEDAEERHQLEIKVYKQKVKHLLYEHQNNISELKAENTVQAELQMSTVTRSPNEEGQNAEPEVMKELKRHYEAHLTEVRNDFERQAQEIEQKYEKKMRQLRDEMDLRRKTEIHEVEERKNDQINTLMKNHEKAFSDIKNYYNDITHKLNNLALINTLKEKIDEMKAKEDRLEKQMAEVMAENRRLSEPLRQAQDENAELKRTLANYEKDKQSLKNAKARIKMMEAERKKLEWEHEVLDQRFEKLQEERDELYRKFEKAIHEVQQKSGLKNILLERKLGTLADTLEKKDAQLNEVLSASNLDPTALTVVTRKLEDVLDSKNSAIKDLQYELARVCKAHNDLLKTYEAKLRQYGIPVEELGFKPLESTVGGQQLGHGPAGLVSAPP